MDPPLRTIFCIHGKKEEEVREVDGNSVQCRLNYGKKWGKGEEEEGRIYLVKTTTGVNGRALNDIIHDLGQWGKKVRGGNFRVEEDFRSQEPFVSYINSIKLLR